MSDILITAADLPVNSHNPKCITPLLGLAAFAFVMVAFFVLDNLQLPISPAAYFVLYEGVFLIGLPLALLVWKRVNPAQGFRLAPASPPAMLGYCTVSVVFIAFYFYSTVLLAKFAPATRHVVQNEAYWIFYSVSRMPPLALLMGGLLVAIGEELFFRGFLLGSLERRFPPALTIAVCGASFAAIHMSFGKFLPTFLAGCWFTYIAMRSGTVWTSVLAHFMLNATAFLLVIGTGYAGQRRHFITQMVSIPWLWAFLFSVMLMIFVIERFFRPSGAYVQTSNRYLPVHSAFRDTLNCK